MCLPLCLLLACSSDNSAGPTGISDNPEADSPAGVEQTANAIALADRVVAVDAALLEFDGDTARHSNVDLTVANGTFVPLTNVTSIVSPASVFWVTTGETVLFEANLYSPGTDEFRFGTWQHSALDIDDIALSDSFVFNRAAIGIDTNADREVDEDELIDIVGGTVEISGRQPELRVSFSVVLSTGEAAQGMFDGEFLIID